MNYKFEDDITETLAYALERFCGDVTFDEEWDPAFDDIAQAWSYSKERGREVRDAWRAVLTKNDGAVARYLVESWANQGRQEPEKALRLLRKWYDHLQPVWDSLEDDEPCEPIRLPPYDCED